ncbi:hypothetical protein QWM81_12400 [Streptomyces ficellus]|uniref:Uncharacterized protein n=1 Tax=Streptomyces ficellus TaxID=1977088 RepID=A0ABT7Z5R5_9ACTN|nr:hypothetical protein [Streptomyces ficellus]MDN3294838.1 hypothetical protein [Streptomyces ficellus]
MPTSKQDVSMRDLLASCAAANAVSTPPRDASDEADEPDATQSAPDAHADREARPEAA